MVLNKAGTLKHWLKSWIAVMLLNRTIANLALGLD